MYCPRCNLHSEEYVDKCPLCEGPMEVDEVASGLMKTPTIPDKDEGTEEFPEFVRDKTLDLPEEVLMAGTDQDQDSFSGLDLDQEQVSTDAEKDEIHLEGPEEGKKVSTVREEEYLFDQGEKLYQQGFTHLAERSGRKRFYLIGGGILIILILAVWGYISFFTTKKPSKPETIQIASALKKTAPITSPAPSQEQFAKEPEKVLETPLTKPEEGMSIPPAEKPTLVSPEKMEKLEAKTEGTLKPLPEAKEPLKPKALSEAPSTKVEPKKTEPITQTPPSPKPPAKEAIQPPKLEAQEPEALAQKSLSKPQEVAALPPKTIPEPQVSALPASNPQGLYAVHVGSFKVEANALELRDKLQKKGYPVAYFSLDISGKGSFYRVMVGNYTDLKEAQKVASRLKTNEKVPALIMKGDKYQ